MAGIYEHIRFQRETVIKERRGNAFPHPKFSGNPQKHAQDLTNQINNVRQLTESEETPGYDDRLLLKVTVRDAFVPTEFESIGGIQAVSQENNEIILLFATESALTDFENRLATFGSTGSVTRKDLIEATKSFDIWSAEDRKGEVLKKEGVPDAESFVLDVELWPLLNIDERNAMIDAFLKWAKENNFEYLDKIANHYLAIVRLKCKRENYEILFKYRDVRTIDLPPKYTLEYNLLQTDIADLPEPKSPHDNAPIIGILDSGLISGHPLLKSSVGDRRSYIEGLGPDDETGHGTGIAGIIAFDDIQDSLQNSAFKPYFWIVSGRILDGNNEYNEKFIENQIEKAVRELNAEYGCRIFNLSIGDERRPYKGGKPGILAMTLDNLSYELNVLFIVSSGNLNKYHIADSIKSGNKYPNYLLEDASILEPANSINSITVGSIARYDQSRRGAYNSKDPSYQAIATINSTSPFSRIGPGVSGSIKPELVAYGGNYGIDKRSNQILEHGLGEITLNHAFSEGKLFAEKHGTSFSAPHITHLAGRLSALQEINQNSILLIRALLISQANRDLLNFPSSLTDDEKIKMVGYGKIDSEYLFKSGEDVVTLFAIDKIKDNMNHFYELPLPDDYFQGRRKREITITLSYFSPTKNTRVNYRGIRMFFKFAQTNSLDHAVKMFNKETPKDEYKKIEEFGSTNRMINAEQRNKGTVQSSSWTLKQPKKRKYFVVVTRNDFPWANGLVKEDEEYALTLLIKDKEKEDVKLYTKINQYIREKIRIRSK